MSRPEEVAVDVSGVFFGPTGATGPTGPTKTTEPTGPTGPAYTENDIFIDCAICKSNYKMGIDSIRPGEIACCQVCLTLNPVLRAGGPKGPQIFLSTPPAERRASNNSTDFIIDPVIARELYEDTRANTAGHIITEVNGKRRLKAVTISYVKDFMKTEYSDAGFNMSTSMDILGVYIKAQKILYTEAKVYCEQQLNMLMLPAIFVSSLCTLLSLALQGLTAGPYVISSLTAVNSFILALISYLKLDAKAEAHKTSAYNYNRLLTICEFESGKIMFFKKENQDEEKYTEMLNLVTEIEKRIEEIQDTNKFILPQYIRYNFRTLNEQNLFSKVKKLQLTELRLLNELKISLRIFREKEYPFLNPTKLDKDMDKLTSTPDTDSRKKELITATLDKEKKMDDIIRHRRQYLELEEAFNEEINSYIEKANTSRCRHCRCNWLKT